MSVTAFRRVVELDANGLPVGHKLAAFKARQIFQDMINELPESVYHLGPTDAEWILDNVLSVYVGSLTKGAK